MNLGDKLKQIKSTHDKMGNEDFEDFHNDVFKILFQNSKLKAINQNSIKECIVSQTARLTFLT